MHERHDHDHHDHAHPRELRRVCGILVLACMLGCVGTDDVAPAMQLRDGDTDTASDTTSEGSECYCPYGTDYLGNPVEGTQCGQVVCGGGNQYYSCGLEGWEFVGGECPEPEPCACPSIYDVHENPIHGASCGDRVCGAGNEYYLCQDGGWIPDGVACGQPSCTTSECPCMDSVVVEGAVETVAELWRDTGISVTAGQTVTIGCGPDAGTISWGGPGTDKTCDGRPFGAVDTWSEAISPGCQVFSLVAKIGHDGAQHCIDAGSSFVATRSGTLYLAFNDGVIASDNDGAWTVDVALECGSDDPDDPCMSGVAPEGHTVYEDTMAGKLGFRNALLTNTATNAITCFELRGAEFEMTATAIVPPPADLRGIEFRERVHGAKFFGSDLRWARFSNLVRNSAFLYANLESTDFGEATLVNDDFAFAQGVDAAVWPAEIVNTVFTGDNQRSATMLPHVRIDGNQELVAALLAGDPEHDGLVGSSWRSYIWDYWHAMGGVQDWELKARVFDAVDQRYWPWGVEGFPRPNGGPTLTHLHGTGPDEITGIIETALSDLVESDEPAYLDDPLIGRVSPHHFREICAVERGTDPFEWYAGLAEHQFAWNSAYPTRNAAEVALFPNLLGYIGTFLADNPAAQAAFAARAADSLFSLGELAADGLIDANDEAIIQIAFVVFNGWCPPFED